MARLNEPPAQVEVNSTQSIRIRTLESEISRLLSENIALRQQVIKLQYEIDNNTGLGSINTVKGRLEAKLLELGGLVQELGNVQQSAEDRRALRRRSGAKSSPKISPDQRNWKNVIPFSEGNGGADGRLPPIVEGKYYPRRTLDAEELGGLVRASGDAGDSPDLGPPPVAHFDAGDPIKFDATHHTIQMPGKADKEGDLNPMVYANLETRRKRRGSSSRVQSTRLEPTDMHLEHAEISTDQIKLGYSLKTGAKRKFTAREEEEEKEDDGTTPEADDFQYNRDAAVAPPTTGNRTKPASSQPEKQMTPRDSESTRGRTGRSQAKPKINTTTHNGRNVLAPKSVNTDPVSSPVKPKRPAEGEKAAPPNHDVIAKSRERNRSKDQLPSQRFGRVTQPQGPVASESQSTLDDVTAPSRPPPETPAPPPLDVLSPDGSEPPTARPESRDTPPPEDLNPETSTTNSFGSLGRSSRRQRGSVSYAEPNLRDKMRRPTKELVDAVAAEERLQQRKNLKAEAEGEDTEALVTGEAASKMRTVVIKKEPTNDDAPSWKAVPAKGTESDHDRLRAEAPSPLGNKAPTVKAQLPASVVTERRRGRPPTVDREQRSNGITSHDVGSGSAIAALMTSKPRTKPEDGSTRAAEPSGISRVEDAADLQELPESLAAEADNGSTATKPAPTRSSRRHSSVSDDRVKDALARRVERRKEGAQIKAARSSVALGVDAGAGEAGRGERAANRRRSMML
ncbi:MAG: hypothetical protein Q9192_005411 [Flavoplaca navasiana]